MQGISSTPAGGVANKKKYNGINHQDDLGLNEYDAFFRDLDPQTGRWWQIDPVTDGYENLSPYASMYNDPMKYSDPLGDEGETCCKDEIIGAINDLMISASGVVNGMLNTGSLGLIPTDPFNFRHKLNEEQKSLYDNSVQVGQIGPLLMPGASSPKTPSLKLVNGPTIPVAVTINPTLVVVPMSGKQADNKRSEEKPERHGGGKNGQHANQKARESAKERYEKVKGEYEKLKSKPNKTTEDKKQLEKLEKQVKHEKQKMDNTGENHSQKAKGGS